ncbi:MULTISPECIES: NAD-dependent epimerase/dehydratase family protein [unclassified Yoonia]|uniref:NAD-dependent epimerase/dehydratase family protein n=1 Tax=unclassified Yoonia TaxID=2629118 RepID=UPI002AFE00D1|nr:MULTISPECIES: NAD-dependent epimerase/dehydratase family protein [unclassified Yoonia]
MTFWTNKTVLVAGGAGFVGVHLVTALVAAGAAVHVVDNFSTSTPARIEGLQRGSNRMVTLTTANVAAMPDLPEADVVFNLASPASPVHYQADPIGTWRTNVMGSYHLMQHATTCGAIMVQASTSEVYGDPLSHPQRETDWGNVNPVGIRSCYDEGKRAAEALLMDAHRLGQVDVRIARIFNTYGPGMTPDDGRALPQFIAQARTGAALTVHGDGMQTRSFCYVSDLVRGLMLLASEPQAAGEVINLGNPHEITVLELAQTIIDSLGSVSTVSFAPRPQDDPSRRCPDIAKAQHLLGWSPQVPLSEGLAMVLAAG